MVKSNLILIVWLGAVTTLAPSQSVFGETVEKEHPLVRAIRANDLRSIGRILADKPSLINAEIPCEIRDFKHCKPLQASLFLLDDPADAYSRSLYLRRFSPHSEAVESLSAEERKRILVFRSTLRETIEFLLTQGAEPDIWTACRLGRVDEASRMLKAEPKLLRTGSPLTSANPQASNPGSPNINDQSDLAYLPIHYAVMSENRKLVAELLALHRAERPPRQIPSLLHLALFRADPELLKMILESGLTDPNDGWFEGISPLAIAAEIGRLDAMKLLIRHGAKVQQGRHWLAPLPVACRAGQFDAVVLLIEKGANPNQESGGDQPGFKDVTPLEQAFAYSHPEIGEYLLGKDARWTFRAAVFADNIEQVKKNFQSLEQAQSFPAFGPLPHLRIIDSGQTRTLEFLLSKGWEVTEDDLLRACRSGQFDMVKLLVKSGIDSKFDNRSGSPIRVAALNGHDKIVEWLLDYGSNPNLALLASLHAKNKRCLELLLDRGADLKKLGGEALGIAVQKRLDLSLLTLLRAGSNPDLIPPDTQVTSYYRNAIGSALTPLQQACLNGDLVSIELLHRFKAKTEPSELDKHTPLHLSVRSRNPKAVAYWLKFLAPVDARDVRQRTPLHFAAENGDLEIVDMLLDAKADPSLKDADGKTALDLAKEKKHKYVVFSLESHAKAKK